MQSYTPVLEPAPWVLSDLAMPVSDEIIHEAELIGPCTELACTRRECQRNHISDEITVIDLRFGNRIKWCTTLDDVIVGCRHRFNVITPRKLNRYAKIYVELNSYYLTSSTSKYGRLESVNSYLSWVILCSIYVFYVESSLIYWIYQILYDEW